MLMRFLLLKLMINNSYYKRQIEDALDDIDIDDILFVDDDRDPERIEIVVSGRFKKDAFKKRKPKSSKEKFDIAKPF